MIQQYIWSEVLDNINFDYDTELDTVAINNIWDTNSASFHFAIIDSIETFDEICNYIEGLNNQQYLFLNEPNPNQWIEKMIFAANPDSLKISKMIDMIFHRNMICTDISIHYGRSILLIESIMIMLDEYQAGNHYNFAIERIMIEVLSFLLLQTCDLFFSNK